MLREPARRVSLNGVNGTTGEPLFPALSLKELFWLALREPRSHAHLRELKAEHERLKESGYGPIFGIDSGKLEETGWGIIVPHGASDRLLDPLEPLISHRQKQAAAKDERRFRTLTYRPGESKLRFLARHGAGAGPVDPTNLPYYLLIVGSPEDIPFEFQYQLDVQYAVGRLHFDDLESYHRYAWGVVASECSPAQASRRAVFFAPAHPDDQPTEQSCHDLAEPLAQKLQDSGWTIDRYFAEEATKTRLSNLFRQAPVPDLLFTAGHGVGFRGDDPRQRSHQGSLLCQDWPGHRNWRGKIPEEFYLCADDLADATALRGLITFHFSCYGAGTPKYDDFSHREGDDPIQIAPQSFVAELPRRLLSHPRGPALAVVAHVDRAWAYSFTWLEAGRQLQVFESALQKLGAGYPIGAAMEFFNQRYAELSSDLSRELQNAKFEFEPDFLTLAGMWTANNDARSYVILGDPAVRLPG